MTLESELSFLLTDYFTCLITVYHFLLNVFLHRCHCPINVSRYLLIGWDSLASSILKIYYLYQLEYKIIEIHPSALDIKVLTENVGLDDDINRICE